MRIIFLIVAIVLSVLHAFAQHTGKIIGRISSADHTPGSGATVTLLLATDSTAIQTLPANKEGQYTFTNVASERYIVSVSLVGFQKAFSKTFQVGPEQKTVQLPAIQLVPLAKTITGVTVTSKKPPVEQKVDRTIIHVEASVTNAGTTALDVLEKAPGVTIDKDGNISLKGKDGVLLLIDGRPTQLSGADLANLLRNLNSTQMDQVEIMTNPPAQYEAAGNAGVINIKTKKNKAAGYNGAVTLGYTQGRYPKVNEGFNFNYKEGKVNVFTNLSHSYRKNFEVFTIQRALRNSTTNEVENHFDQQADGVSVGRSLNGKLGMDYFINKKTTVGLTLSGFYNTSDGEKHNRTYISSTSKELENITNAFVDNGYAWNNFSSNAYFRRVFDTTGKEITADLDYMTYNTANDQFMMNSYFDADGSSVQKADTLLGDLPQFIRIYSGKIDYLHPLKKGARFEAGVKSSVVRTDNQVRYDSIQYGGRIQDIGRSNHFVYEENINAAYVNVNAPLTKKIQAQLGLRLENTNAKGLQLTTGEAFDRHYTQLFPTAYVQYNAGKKHHFGLNFGRRIRRPNYQSLNPFIRFIDRYTYNKGNPDLKPQFGNNLELTHTYRNFLTTTLNYSVTNNIILGVVEQRGKEAYAIQSNMASMRQYGVAVGFNKAVTGWWTNSLYLNVFNNHFRGNVSGVTVSHSATSVTVNGSQQFKLSKTTTAEINGFYRSGGVQGVMYMKSRGAVSVGFSRQVWEKKGNISLTVRDIFYTQRGRAIARYGNVDAAFQEVGDSRVVAVGFTYRFSKGKVNGQKKRTTGSAGEEQDRVGVN